MKYFIILTILLTGQAYAIDFGNDQNNRQTNRQVVDQNQQQQQRQNQSQQQTANGGRGGQGGNANSDANSRSRSINEGNNTAIQYTNDYKKTYQEFVSTAYAPPLAASGDCLGSASAGGSNSVMGFSIGKTYIDENCNARYDAALLWSMGRHEAAVQRLCSQPEMAKILPECPGPEEVQTTANNGWLN